MHALLSVLLLTGYAQSPYCRHNAFRAIGEQRYRMYCVRAPKAILSLAAATNQKERERGLMDVRVLPARVGMVFKFVGGDDFHVLWMKNTLIPLDMVYVRADGTVSSIEKNVPATRHATPDQKIPRRYGNGQFVIELNAGEAARDGLAPGVRLVFPNLRAV
jgi:uncharacterized membrane protein (UPF0127 family)